MASGPRVRPRPVRPSAPRVSVCTPHLSVSTCPSAPHVHLCPARLSAPRVSLSRAGCPRGVERRRLPPAQRPRRGRASPTPARFLRRPCFSFVCRVDGQSACVRRRQCNCPYLPSEACPAFVFPAAAVRSPRCSVLWVPGPESTPRPSPNILFIPYTPCPASVAPRLYSLPSALGNRESDVCLYGLRVWGHLVKRSRATRHLLCPATALRVFKASCSRDVDFIPP